MTLDHYADDAEAARNASPTAHLLEELALYAHRPYDDEADPRPLPEPAKLQGALADMFDALVATLSDTRLEPDLHALLWSVVNVFHRRIDRIERDLDVGSRRSPICRHSPRTARCDLQMLAQLAHRQDRPLRAHADVHAARRKVSAIVRRIEQVISIYPSHRIPICLSFYVSVYITV